MITGEVAHIELTSSEDSSEVTATCIEHAPGPDGFQAEACTWIMHFSSFEAAICTPFAEDHADTGRMHK